MDLILGHPLATQPPVVNSILDAEVASDTTGDTGYDSSTDPAGDPQLEPSLMATVGRLRVIAVTDIQ